MAALIPDKQDWQACKPIPLAIKKRNVLLIRDQ